MRKGILLQGVLFFMAGCKSQAPTTFPCQPQLSSSSDRVPLTCGAASGGQLSCTLDFGGVPIGQSAATTLSLSNAVATSCDLIGETQNGDPQFEVQQVSLPATVAVGVPLTVTFKPFNDTALSDTFTLLTDSQLTPNVVVHLRGNGVRIGLGVNPTSLDFGKVVIHSSVKKTLTLTNLSTGDITVAQVASGGPSAGLFLLQGDLANGPKSLSPAETTQLDVSFSPQRPSSADEIAYLVFSYADGHQALVGLKGFAVASALVVQPTGLSFGAIPINQSYAQTLTVANVTEQPVELLHAWIDNLGLPVAFSTTGPQILPGSPFSLAGKQTLSYPITFAPGQGQAYQGDFAVASDQGDNLHVALTGSAGGPSISCVPTDLQFGLVDLGVGATLSVTCTNVGNDRVLPGGKIDVSGELQILQATLPIFPSDAPYTAQLTLDGQETDQVSLLAGQSATILVTYDPLTAGSAPDAATLFVQSNDVLHPEVPIRLGGGGGLALADCSLAVAPVALTFDQIDVGQSVTLPITLTNTGNTECLVDGLTLSSDTDPSFTLAMPLGTSLRLQGNLGPGPSQISVLVAFAPTRAASFKGALDFTISSHAAPMQSIPITGSAATTCLVLAPQSLDFGDVGMSGATQFCGSKSHQIRAFNNCSTPLEITGLSNSAQTTDFQITSSPTLPTLLQPGSFFDFSEAFRPTAAGVRWGSATVVAQPANGGSSTSYLAAFHGNASTSQQVDTYLIPPAKVDILWVVGYGDISSDQDLISSVENNIGSFFGALQGVDYHLGVISSVDCTGFVFGGAANATDLGQILPCSGCTDGSAPAGNLITSHDPNPESEMQTILSTMVQNGLSGNPAFNFCQFPPVNGNWDGEDVFQPAFLALQPALLAGHNSGFLRNDAALTVIGLNASDDLSQSISGEGTAFYTGFFQSVKAFNPQTPFIFNAISITPNEVTNNVFQCPADQNIFLQTFLGDTNIPLMVGQTGGQLFDVCTQDWPTTLTNLGTASRATQATFVVNGSPENAPGGITVAIDGTNIPQYTRAGGSQVWTYDPVTGTLTFLNTGAVPEPGDTLTISYTNTCYSY